MRKIMPLMLIVVLMFTAIGCSSIKNGTPEQAAETFMQAMIEGDEKVIDELNKSDVFMYPTHFLISEYCPKYADLNISDYDFKANQKQNIVTMYDKSTGEDVLRLKISKIGDKYYFKGF